MNKGKKIIIKITLLIFLFFFSASNVFALDLNLNSNDQFLKDAAGASGYNTAANDPDIIIGSIIKTLISFLGVIFFILVVYGGFMWMTARGNEPQIESAKKIITNSIIGLVVVMFAYAITWYIVYQLAKTTNYGA
jgi:hypothetical protein